MDTFLTLVLLFVSYVYTVNVVSIFSSFDNGA